MLDLTRSRSPSLALATVSGAHPTVMTGCRHTVCELCLRTRSSLESGFTPLRADITGFILNFSSHKHPLCFGHVCHTKLDQAASVAFADVWTMNRI